MNWSATTHIVAGSKNPLPLGMGSVKPAPEETVKPEVTPSPTETTEQNNGSDVETGNYATPWIWGGVIVVAVIGIGAVLFMKKKKQ